MIIPIDHKHRIRSDEHCWAVETTRKRGSKTCWRGISYHPTLEAAVNSLGRRMVRTSNATTLVEALRAVEDISAKLCQALTPEFEVKRR
jgi:hypothetical protein